MEDYVKSIMHLERENKVARVSDISRRMNVKKASVVAAVACLQKNSMLTHEKYGYISLTEAGRATAAALEKKYGILYGFFTGGLGMEPEKAALEACAAEHAVSADTAEKISAFAKAAKKAQKAAAPTPKKQKPAKAAGKRKK